MDTNDKLSQEAPTVEMYFFCIGTSVSECCKMLKQKVSHPKIIQWFVYFRDICSQALLADTNKLGGPGVIVEIDECALGRK